MDRKTGSSRSPCFRGSRTAKPCRQLARTAEGRYPPRAPAHADRRPGHPRSGRGVRARNARCASGTSPGRRGISEQRAQSLVSAIAVLPTPSATSSASLTPSATAASRMRSVGFAAQLVPALGECGRGMVACKSLSTQMETNGDLDPGWNRPAVAHRRQKMPTADRRRGGTVERMVAAAAMQDDLDSGAGSIEADSPHQGPACWLSLDGASGG